MADTLLPPKANHRLGASASSTSQQQHQEQQQPTNGMIEIRDIKLHLRQKSYKYTANLSCRTTKQQQQLSASSRGGNHQQQFTTNSSSIFNNNNDNTVDADPTLASSFSGIEDIEKKITSELDASTSIEIKNTNNNNNNDDSTRNSSNLDNNNNNDNNKRTSSLNNSITVQEGTTGKPVPDICFGAETKFRLTFPLSMVRDQSGSITPRGGGGVTPRSGGGSTNVTPSASPQRVSSSNRNSAASNNNNEQEGTVATTTSLKRRGSFSLQGKLANPDDLISQAKLKVYVTLIITKYIDELEVEKCYEQTVLVDLSRGKVNHCKVEFGEVGGASFEVRSVEVEEVEEVLNKSFGSLGGMMMSKETSDHHEQQEQQNDEEEDVKKENEEDVRKEEENVKTGNDDDNTHDKKNDNDDDENTRNSNTEPKEIEVKPTEVAQDAEIVAEDSQQQQKQQQRDESLTKNKNSSEPLSGSATGGYGTIDNVATETTENTKEGTKSSKQNKKKETDALLPKQQKKEKSSSCCCCC